MKIYVNITPGNMGGPSVFVKNFVEECIRRKHRVTYNLEPDCDSALILVSANDKVFEKCKKFNIKTVGRLDGFYIPEYWDNRKDRKMTIDKIQTNNRMREDLKLYDEVIFQSQWSKDMFDKWIFERKNNFHIVHNGVNTKMFRRSKAKQNGKTILMLGALRHSYMMETFFGAYQAINSNKTKTQWLIAGTLDKQCRNIFSKYSHKNNVKYLGPFDHNALPNIYNKADIFLHPRLGDSCPNVILEAQSCGLGVVCGSWGGASELIHNGGIVVPTDKWSYGIKYQTGCGRAIQTILEKLDYYTFKARANIEKRFSIERMVDDYIRILTP